jgi:C4-dicarboxylate transporter DctM subunit
MGVFQIGLLYVGAAFLLFFSGVPIAFALGSVALLFMLVFMPSANIEMVAQTFYGELNNFTLLAIPLFILMGAAIGKTRAAVDLYESTHRWLYRLPGGLGVANVTGCAIFAAMCGSSPATCAAIGGMGIPEMRRRGYSAELAAGLIAAGGTLGILIPPSITLIIYGIITEQSIGRLFMAGVVPGIMLAVFFALWVIYVSVREKRRALADANVAQSAPGQPEEKFSWRERFETIPRLMPFLVLIAVVMAAMYGGWATPSEVAGVGALGALLIVVFVYRVYRWHEVKDILTSAACESCMIMMIIATAYLFTYVMSYLHITQSATEWVVSLPLSKWEYLSWINVLLVVLGFFLPPVAIILMVTPVILPGLQAHGFDLVWYGVIMTILMEMGLIHPPVGLNLFVINGIAPDITFKQIIYGVIPFIIIMLVSIVLLSVFPQIVMWLPNQMYGSHQ